MGSRRFRHNWATEHQHMCTVNAQRLLSYCGFSMQILSKELYSKVVLRSNMEFSKLYFPTPTPLLHPILLSHYHLPSPFSPVSESLPMLCFSSWKDFLHVTCPNLKDVTPALSLSWRLSFFSLWWPCPPLPSPVTLKSHLVLYWLVTTFLSTIMCLFDQLN